MAEIRTFKALSPAKLNLTLAVLGSLDDGFHEVETLMQAVNLSDDLRFAIHHSTKTSIQIYFQDEGSVEDFPLDQNNLIAKAIKLFLKNAGEEKLAVNVEVRKSIPIAAGLGGGSSNAAATLMVLNRYFNSVFRKPKLEEMAAELGADVPFFIHGGTQIGRHKGELLTAVPTTNKMYFTIVKPKEISISTPWIYEQYDSYVARKRTLVDVALKPALTARTEGMLSLAAKSFCNVFESIVYEHYPELAAVRDRIVELGAFGSGMTGSGPTLFGLCDSQKQAAAIAKAIKAEEIRASGGKGKKAPKLTIDAWPAESIDRGPTIIESSPHTVRGRRA